MADFPDVKPNDENLRLISSNQSYESVLTGDKKTAELSGDKWAATLQFSNRHGTDAAKLRAWLFSLGGSRTRFKYSPESISNLGTASGAGVVNGADQTGSELLTSGWDADQDNLFSAGDYIEVNGELKIVTGDVAASTLVSYPDATNLMPSPFDPSGWYGASDPDLSYQSVTETNPSGQNFVGEFEYVGPTFPTIVEVLGQSFNSGTTLYFGIIAKVDQPDLGLRIRFQDGSTQLNNTYIDVNSGGSDGAEIIKVSELSGGFKLFEVGYTLASDVVDFRFYAQFYKVSVSPLATGFPAVGDKIKCQAAFFGKSGKFPGSVSYTGTNYMPSPFDPSGWYGATTDPDGTITNVELSNASGTSFMGLAERTGAGGFNLTGFPTISTEIGDELAGAMLFRKANDLGAAFRFRLADSSGFLADIAVSSTDGSYITGGLDYQVTMLGDDILLQFKYTTIRDSGAGVYCQSFIWTSDNSGESPIGSQLYVQAAFFGKADDWPAVVVPADPNQFPAEVEGSALIPIAPKLRNSPPDGASIITDKPSATFRLENDDQAQFQIQGPLIYNASFSLLEDF